MHNFSISKKKGSRWSWYDLCEVWKTHINSQSHQSPALYRVFDFFLNQFTNLYFPGIQPWPLHTSDGSRSTDRSRSTSTSCTIDPTLPAVTIYIVQDLVQPRKSVLDHADHTAPTRQHELLLRLYTTSLYTLLYTTIYFYTTTILLYYYHYYH